MTWSDFAFCIIYSGCIAIVVYALVRKIGPGFAYKSFPRELTSAAFLCSLLLTSCGVDASRWDNKTGSYTPDRQ